MSPRAIRRYHPMSDIQKIKPKNLEQVIA